MQAHIAANIMQQRPWAVVFETAVTPQHGLASGNVFDCSSAVKHSMQAYFVRWLCPLAGQLSGLPNPVDSALWQAWCACPPYIMPSAWLHARMLVCMWLCVLWNCAGENGLVSHAQSMAASVHLPPVQLTCWIQHSLQSPAAPRSKMVSWVDCE